MPFQQTTTDKGHVGPKPTDVSVRINNDRLVRADCMNNLEFWLEFTVPEVLPATVVGVGRVGQVRPAIRVDIGGTRHARATCSKNPEFWLEFVVPEPNAEEWNE